MAAIVISAGGTGGHVYPALAVAEELAMMRPDIQVVFAGTTGGLEARVVPPTGLAFETVCSGPWRRARPWTILTASLKAAVGAVAARGILRRHGAVAVFSTGGYASAPVLLAATLMGVPIVLHEPNAQPGVVTRIFGGRSARVTVVSEEAGRSFPPSRTLVTGVPVRRSIHAGRRDEARNKLGFEDEFVLLILGGSQGAGGINSAVEAALPLFAGQRNRISIIWICGKRDLGRATITAASAPVPVRVLDYSDEMGTILRASDLAVARAGASATAEILSVGLPSLLVPYPHAAADHQRRNAESLERSGAAKMMPESLLTGETLAGEVLAVAGDAKRRSAMAECARSMGRPGAARAVAEAVLSTILGGGVRC